MKKILLFLCLPCIFLTAAYGAVLGEDAFDYPIGSSTTSWKGGRGFSQRWNVAADKKLTASIVHGLSFGTMPVSGNALQCTYTQDSNALAGANVWRPTAFAVDSGTLWLSYLYRFDTAGVIHPEDVALSVRFGMTLRSGINEKTSAFFIQYHKNASKAVSAANKVFKDGTTLFLVFSFADMGNPEGSHAKGWALTESGYASLLKDGINEKNLDANAYVSVQAKTAEKTTLPDSTSFLIAPSARGVGSTMACTIDEISIGTALSDVIATSPGNGSTDVSSRSAIISAKRPDIAIGAPHVDGEQGGPIRPLAQSHVTVAQSPDPKRIPVYTPSILTLPNGRLVASYIFGQKRMSEEERKVPPTVILTSDDHGQTWQERHRADIPSSARLFSAGDSIYLMGHKGDLRILASHDNGETWGETVNLTEGQKWHQAASNVWKTRGNIYLVMERHVSDAIQGWTVGQLAPVLMRAKETDDLTNPKSWTFSNQDMAMMDIIPNYRQNDLPFEYFGIPFYRQSFPNETYVTLSADEQAAYAVANEKPPRKDRLRHFAPMGWLESNVVQITDPDHIWYDPSGKTFHIFMRAHTGGTGYAALMKAVEKDDGSIEVGYEHAPSGKIMLFLPFPGGQMRFHMIYDPQTQLYWMLGTQATDSMVRPDKMDSRRFDLPNNERQRMVLHFSKNMVDWCFAGVVAKVSGLNESRHYASMDIDGDDLVILSRSGDTTSDSAHNGNMATFHRVKNFRDLVY